MQLTGGQFTSETAILGNDLSTYPDFPAEIRAPAGSLPGVSGFQLHFADHDILTPGDAPNVLVAMNPAALKTNIKDLPKGGTLIVNTDAFKARNLEKAGYAVSPLEDGSLSDYQVHEVPLTTMTVEALKDIEGITPREAERSKNMFALGLMSWLYTRPIEGTIAPLEKKFAKRPEIAEANVRALRAGWAFGETTEGFAVTYEVKPAKLAPGHLPQHHREPGALARARRGVAASKLPLFLGAYPITPASAMLEELAGYKHFGVRTFQAEDEIAAVGAALGASFGGALGITTLVRPGHRAQVGDDRARDHARAAAPHRATSSAPARRRGCRPSRSRRDLLMVLFGRNGESPIPVVAAAAGGLLRRGARGGADRAQVPDAGLPPLGRVPRERLGAVAHPGRRRPAGHLDPVRDGAERRRGVPAVPARRGDARAAVGRPGHAGPRAPHRRAREGGPHGHHLLRPGQPRPDGAHARAEGRRDRERHPASSRSTTRGARVLVLGWGGTYGPIAAACAACARRAARSPTRTCAT